MRHSLKEGNLQRVAYSVFVIALIACAVYVFAVPSTRVDAQKFEKTRSTGGELLATATFPTSAALPMDIPDNAPGAGLNLPITVAGLTDQVRGVALNITFENDSGGLGNPGHSWVGDLDMTLTEPGANSHLIFDEVANAGNDSSDLIGPYTFTDGTTGDWSTVAAATAGGDPIAPGLYRTEDATGVNTDMNPVFQGPALYDPRAGFEKHSSKTIPMNPPDNLGNGVWMVAVNDDAGGDIGAVSALSITITTLAPTTALADIRGGVQTAFGNPISRAYVTILNTETNETMTAQTNQFGIFRFEGLPVGVFYTMWVEHGRYQFDAPVQSFTLDGDKGDAIFRSTN